MGRKSADEVTGRRAEIIRHLRENTYMTVAALSEATGVSEVTIRRDLDVLDADGRLERKRGGAFIGNVVDADDGPGERSASTDGSELITPAKRIARAAFERIIPEEVVLLASGPISEEIARAVVTSKSLVVITNSVRVFEILETNRRVHLISTGGELRHSSGTLIGPIAEAAIANLRADRFILEPSGISESHGLYSSSLPDVPVLRAMIQAARDIMVVAGREVFDREGIMQVAPTSVATQIITDAVDSSLAARLEEEGISVVTT